MNAKNLFLAILVLNVISSPLSAHNTPQFSIMVAHSVAPYFLKFYADDPKAVMSRIIRGKKYTVFRFIHGLPHGLRQGFLALDIVEAFEYVRRTKDKDFFKTISAKEFSVWIDYKISTDPLFKDKVQFWASFQRTGRQSEANSTSNPEQYVRYIVQEMEIFKKEAAAHSDQLFKDPQEIKVYAEALLIGDAQQHRTIKDSDNKDIRYLRKLLIASHMLDLRRITTFDEPQVKSNISYALFDTPEILAGSGEETFINVLFERSGNYLAATGDKDLVKGKKHYNNRFFILSTDPLALVNRLFEVNKQMPFTF